MLTDIQVLIFTGVIGAVISMFTARATTSTAAVSSLNMALTSLRTEFEAIQRDREVERQERESYKAYIEILVKLLNAHSIEVPAFPGRRTEDVYDK
jgi:hypothetical protein